MFIRDFEQTREIRAEHELVEFLARRHDKDGVRVNSFWMCHTEDVPAMGMMVREDFATVDYMADSEGTAFTSLGEIPALRKGGTTLFWFDERPVDVHTHLVIDFEDAVRAAKEFLQSPDLPKSIKWLQL